MLLSIMDFSTDMIIKFDDTFLTFPWGNKTLMWFSVLKPGETFSILEKPNHHKKVLFAQDFFFEFLNIIIANHSYTSTLLLTAHLMGENILGVV